MKINLVVTCTNRKKLLPEPELMLRSIKSVNLEKCCEAWIKRLSDKLGFDPPIPARDLYSGDHWSVASSIIDSTEKERVRLWICSAGYGLIPSSAEIYSYAATFTPSHPDSIYMHTKRTGRTVAQDWWRLLSDMRLSSCGERPRSLTELAKREPDAVLLVAVSLPYLEAIGPDLELARSALKSPDLLSIISCGASDAQHLPTSLTESLIPCDARFVNHEDVGGVRGSLNVRIARKIVLESNNHPVLCSKLKKRYEQLRNELPAAPSFNRQPCSDDDIKAWIRKELEKNQRASRTSLLRSFRDGDKACEQRRFAELFNAVREELPWEEKR